MLLHALSSVGVDVPKLLNDAGAGFRAAVGDLLARAQAQRVVRDDVDVRDVLDLLLAVAHTAGEAPGKAAKESRALTVVIDGLRPKGTRR